MATLIELTESTRCSNTHYDFAKKKVLDFTEFITQNTLTEYKGIIM